MIFYQIAISNYIPDFSTSGLIPVITFFIFFIIIAILIAILAYFIAIMKIYNKKIQIFEKIGGRIILTKKDRAREIKIGNTGDTAFRTRKTKKILPTPSIQSGKRVYWFYIREDNEWINFGIGDIDEEMRQIKAHFLDKEMRYARTQLQKSMQERYQKITFLEKYGGLLVWTFFLIIMGIVMWLWFDKLTEMAGVAKDSLESARQVQELAKDTLISVDNIRSGGSGIIPAN